MPTATSAPPRSQEDAGKRTPGWERILDAFMADPDRVLTNVQLGQVRGVQAFHQRLTDLLRKGYVLTPAVQLRKGHYAYALVGIGGGYSLAPLPYRDQLPAFQIDEQPDAVQQKITWIEENADRYRARSDRPQIQQAPGVARLVRDAVMILQEALPEARLKQLASVDPASREDLLVLAQATSREIASLRDALRDESASALALVHDALGDPSVPLVVEAVIEAVARLRTRPVRQPRGEHGPTGPQLMRRALEYHEQPMHSAKIAEWVMANGGDALYKGLTPAATMAAQLATSNKQGGEFVKVAPGCYALREWDERTDDFGNNLLELDVIR